MGSNKTSSNSAPLTAEERQRTYEAAVNNLWNVMPKNPYEARSPERISGGDYDALQNKMTQGYMAALDRSKSNDLEQLNNSLAKRGIWSSGLATQAENDLLEGYAAQYAKAGADATQARYTLQAQDLANANQFNSTEADRVYQSKWRPADYLAGIWNGTGGVVSSSSGGGWSI